MAQGRGGPLPDRPQGTDALSLPDAEAPSDPDAEPDAERTPIELRIEIDADGRVVLTDLPADLVELVRKLDPDAVLSCDIAQAESPGEGQGEPE